MNPSLAICTVFALVMIHSELGHSYHPDWSWKNVESMMNPDLKGRMKRSAVTTRRKYCSCPEVPGPDSYSICANNGIMYPTNCIFECNQRRTPGLEEANDYAKCGSETFKHFKLNEFKPHY